MLSYSFASHLVTPHLSKSIQISQQASPLTQSTLSGKSAHNYYNIIVNYRQHSMLMSGSSHLLVNELTKPWEFTH